MTDIHDEGYRFKRSQNLQDNEVSIEDQNKHYLIRGC